MVQPATRRRKTPVNAGEVPVPVSGTALLLIDVINDLAFDGSDVLVAQAESMAVLKANVAVSTRLRFQANRRRRTVRRRARLA
jgi:hypothetical protein